MQPTSSTYLSLFLPTWSTDLLRRHVAKTTHQQTARTPIILFVEHRGQQFVARVSKEARALGISPFMTLAHARACAPTATIAPFRAADDLKSLLALGRWAERFSPLTAVDPPELTDPALGLDLRHNGLVIDITGSKRLFGSFQAIAEQLDQRLRSLQIAARIAITPTQGAGWAFSRYGPHRICRVDRESLRTALAPLPIQALRLDDVLCEELHAVGITCMQHLLAIPPRELAARFGEPLTTRIQQVLGLCAEPLHPIRTTVPIWSQFSFDSPITRLESIHLALQRLIESVMEQLRAQQKQARSLTVTFHGNDTSTITKHITLHVPTADGTAFWRLLRPRLESLRTTGGGIEALTLTVKRSEYRHPHHLSLLEGHASNQSTTRAIGELIDTLTAQLGEQRILRGTRRASHIPERSFQLDIASPDDLQRTPASRTPPLPTRERPSTLFSTPQAITALSLLPDHPPERLQWNGETFLINHGLGPERIAHEWWRGPAPAAAHTYRDYFTVQTQDGTWLWVYREAASQRWFLHGIWS
ncbi:MAG: DNA polymerase Y family protein [Bdellovibrionales bacterium]|nr:DNA polymerase Y family protein [Bdellovibrionales bacterium]